VVALAGLAFVGCGAGHSAAPATRTVTTTATATATSTSRRPPAPTTSAAVSETVRVLAPNAPFTSSATARPGATIQFRTVVASPRAAPVRLSFGLGPGATLTATATVDGGSSTAVVTGGGANLALRDLRYTCLASPAPSFCPVSQIASTSTTTAVTFNTTRHVPIVIAATAAAANAPADGTGAPPPIARRSRAFLAGRAVALAKPAAGSRAPFSSTVSVQSGQVLVLVARVIMGATGAPGQLRLTLGLGPSHTLRATASVTGGGGASVNIVGRGAAPIMRVAPRYTCYLPPTPTACPALRAGAKRGTYTAVFAASAVLAPLVLLATVAQR
jgi:hypothetical protein